MAPAAGKDSMTKPHWIYLALIGLTPVLLGAMIAIDAADKKQFRADIGALTESVSGLRTDVAVMKNTIQSIVSRDVPTRAELRVSLDTMARDMTKLETRVTSLEERVRLLENKR